MELKVKRLPHAEGLPELAYATRGSSCFDLYAAHDQPIMLNYGEQVLIPTGFAFEIPIGYEMQIRARSGFAAKSGIGLTNGIGTIDSDYRGEVVIPLVRLSKALLSHKDRTRELKLFTPFSIERGMRIAQAAIVPVNQVIIQEVAELSETKRGEGGFGSTGV